MDRVGCREDRELVTGVGAGTPMYQAGALTGLRTK
jgi:hypothetical protein